TYKLWGADFMAWARRFTPDNEGLNHHVVQGQWFGAEAAMEAMKALGPKLTRTGLRDMLYSHEWDTGPCLDQKFLWEPSQRGRQGTASRHEYMYKYTGHDKRAPKDGSLSPGLIPAPEQFEINDTFD